MDHQHQHESASNALATDAPEGVLGQRAHVAHQPAEDASRPTEDDPLTGVRGPAGARAVLKPIDDGRRVSLDDPRLFISRDTSWLEFNRRVLALAVDDRTPLLERVKFLAICASNLDEFFMKRVGLFKTAVASGKERSALDGVTVLEELTRCRAIAADLQAVQSRCWGRQVRPALARERVAILDYDDLSKAERDRVDRWFDDQVFPVLTPLAVDKGHRFPFISNLSESLGILVSTPGKDDRLFARVKIPDMLPRLISVPERGPIGEPIDGKKAARLVPLDQIIQRNLDAAFPGMEIVDVMPFRITRSSGVERDEDDYEDLLELVEAQLESRRFAEAVRIEVCGKPSAEILELLTEELQLTDDDVFVRDGWLEYDDLLELASLNRPDLKYPPFQGVVPSRLRDDEKDIFSVIRERDVFVHHPYESFHASTERFIEEAAGDPNVLAIKQTLYRTSRDSPFVESLIRAAQEGKQVACLVELRARFDENKNVRFARQLEKHGVHVAYGVVGLKTHCKCSLVVRREGGKLRSYAHVGTGNYHPGTAQLYTDCGVLTCEPAVTADVVNIFNYLTGRSRHQRYNRLLVAPITMRRRFYALIDKEIENAKAGRPARVFGKMNQLEDEGIIKRLYKASRAGVEVTVLVRGFCCLRPQVPGLSENIRIISIIGRYLEHSRIFHFADGQEDPVQGKWFIGSADWMSRNLTNRVEAAMPVHDGHAKARLWQIIEAGLRDHRCAWVMGPEGDYAPLLPNPTMGPETPESVGTFETLCRAADASTGRKPVSGETQPTKATVSAGLG